VNEDELLSRLENIEKMLKRVTELVEKYSPLLERFGKVPTFLRGR
jgi:hypothetical protein